MPYISGHKLLNGRKDSIILTITSINQSFTEKVFPMTAYVTFGLGPEFQAQLTSPHCS